MAQKFGTKERANLTRKLAESSHYRADREDLTRKLAATDCQKYAILAVTNESLAEIATEMEFEQYRQLLKSMQNAIESSRQVVSFIGKSERNT
jgi:hypothetical protein